MKKDPDTEIKRGTKNIFADLGFPDAETHLLKAELVTRIQAAMDAQELTQTAAAGLMGLSQPDVSRLLNGQFRDVSVERLLRMLTRLGCDVDITIRGHGKAASPRDTIRLRQDVRTGTAKQGRSSGRGSGPKPLGRLALLPKHKETLIDG
jgi:predicted XRE-type DNA-binding protein